MRSRSCGERLDACEHLLGGALDMVAIGGERAVEIARQHRLHDALMLGDIVARLRAARDRERHIALALVEERLADRDEHRRAAAHDERAVKAAMLPLPGLCDARGGAMLRLAL